MYPKIFTHCSDHNSKVVVANAEQEAQLPAEFLPAVAGASGSAISAADQATSVMLSPQYSQLLTDREALARERAEFAEHAAADRQALEDKRPPVQPAGDAAAPATTTDSAAPPAAAPAADTTAATPAKRVRHAKAD